MDLARLSKYTIVAKIGQGGMGEVYRAHDPVLGRDVAIKTMTASGGAGDQQRKRFHREAQSAARLNHPNIITVYDFGEEQGRMYIAMELLEGRDLRELITDLPPLSLERKLNLMIQVSDGLAFAHSKGVIHRDLKPGNIHVQGNGQVKIMDFGLARDSSSDMTRTGTILGTPHYMSPEQVRGQKATAQSDVFSLGAVFYELLSGKKPFEADSLVAILFQVIESEPPSLDTLQPALPPALSQVIRRAMAKDPAHRYSDAGQLLEALLLARPWGMSTPTPQAGLTPAGGTPIVSLGATITREPVTPGLINPVTMPSPVRGAAAREPVPLSDTSHEDTGGGLQPTISSAPTTQVDDSAAPRGLATSRTAISSPPRPGARPVGRGRGLVPALAVGGVGLLVAAVGGVYWFLSSPTSVKRVEPTVPPVVTTPPSIATPPPTSPPSLADAQQRLDEKDYRAAVVLAEEAVRLDPRNAMAQRLLEKARRGQLDGDAAAEGVRKSLESGDGAQASQALSRLAALDPRNPRLPELTARLHEVIQRERTRHQPEATPIPTQATLPPVTPAPSTAPSATPAPVATPTIAELPASPAAAAPDESAVLRTLAQYREACRRLDAVAIRRMFPLIKDDALKAFSKMSRYLVKFDDLHVVFEGERTATVTCHATYDATPKDANRVGSRWEGRQTIRLENQDGAWVIRSIE